MPYLNMDDSQSLTMFYVGICILISLLLIILVVFRKSSNITVNFSLHLAPYLQQHIGSFKSMQRSEQILRDYIQKYMPEKTFKQLVEENGPELEQKDVNQSCPICLSDYTMEDQVLLRMTLCQHYFHKECIDSWLKKHFNCPFCRFEHSQMNFEAHIKKLKKLEKLKKKYPIKDAPENSAQRRTSQRKMNIMDFLQNRLTSQEV